MEHHLQYLILKIMTESKYLRSNLKVENLNHYNIIRLIMLTLYTYHF